jgi:hypothetical protein
VEERNVEEWEGREQFEGLAGNCDFSKAAGGRAGGAGGMNAKEAD